MTANYVDELVWMAKNRGDSLSRQLADLVRQQAQEIAMLKQIIDANNLSQNIGQEIENEPVAWMTENGTIFDELPLIAGGLIPLYTHHVRELTDEEIEEVAKPYCDLQNWVVDKHEFARAILKKASEK